MNTITISTKELREELPRIREGLLQGKNYTLIYRSKPIAQLEPISQQSEKKVRVKGGTLQLQRHTKQQLTPPYLNKLAAEKHE